MSTYDVLIRNARIVDGTGNPGTYGDVAIAGGAAHTYRVTVTHQH